MSLDDDQPPREPVETLTGTLSSHTLLARINDVTRELYREGIAESARRSYTGGARMRWAANRLRIAVGLPYLIAFDMDPGPMPPAGPDGLTPAGEQLTIPMQEGETAP